MIITASIVISATPPLTAGGGMAPTDVGSMVLALAVFFGAMVAVIAGLCWPRKDGRRR